MKIDVTQALALLKQNAVIAYPTETTFGLGCDAFSDQALTRLLKIKARQQNKGFIILINQLAQLDLFTENLTSEQLDVLDKHWPGPYTFVFPCKDKLSPLLTGRFSTIAIRMSSHPVAQALCQYGPITSTSANLSGHATLQTAYEIDHTFNNLIDGVIDEVPGHQAPSQIIDIQTGQRYR